MTTKSNHINQRGRTRAEVLAAQRTPYGCCDRHAGHRACDCLSEAVDTCPACGGSGTDHERDYPHHDRPYRCRACHGRGQVYVPGVGQDAEDDPICPACRGSGYVDNGDSQPHPCGRCITEGR